MSKKKLDFWLKDDFRVIKKLCVSKPLKTTIKLLCFIYIKKNLFENQVAQKWWVSRSLEEFKKKLDELNISLEIIKVKSYKFSLKSF